MVKFVCLVAALVVVSVNSHGNIIRVSSSSGEAGPMGQNAFRDGIVRGDSGVPGPEQGYRCDWCVLENRPRQDRLPACLDGGCPENGWWTETPAAHWDNIDNWPSIPCMSNDSFGQRGTLSANAGEGVNTQLYVNADHGGFYRYEYANGTNPSNADFMANAVTPWYSFHASAETVGSYEGRVVGYTKQDTDNYLYDMNRVPGGGLGGDRLNPGSQDPDRAPANAFLDDVATIPTSASGEGVLRLNWFSAETSQIYTNCIDMVISGTGSPEPPVDPPPGVCMDLPGNSGAEFFDGNNGCEGYELYDWCEEYGATDWNGEGTANDKCCACGGGNTGEEPPAGCPYANLEACTSACPVALPVTFPICVNECTDLC